MPIENFSDHKSSGTCTDVAELFRSDTFSRPPESKILSFCAAGDPAPEMAKDQIPNYKPEIEQDRLNESIESMRRQVANHKATEQTAQVYEQAARLLTNWDLENLYKVLKQGLRDPRVDMRLVVHHLRELSEKAFPEEIAPEHLNKAAEGSFNRKDPKNERYLSISWNKSRNEIEVLRPPK